jgi:O-antigen ligase
VAPSLLPEHWIAASSERTTGTLGRVAEFSCTLTASMLLVAHYAFYARKRLIQILCLIGLFLGSLCLVLSFSRGTWLASCVAAVLVIIFYRRMAPYILTLGAIIVLVLTTNIFADAVTFASERLTYERTVDSRITSNYAALGMIAAKPILGWGYGNFTRYHLDFVKPVGGVAVTDIHISSHNTYLSMAVELGLVGLIAFLMPWLLLLRKSISVYKRLPRDGFYSRQLLVVLWIGAAFWFLVTNFMNMRLAAWGITWSQLLLGLIASIVDAGPQLPTNNETHSAAPNSFITGAA